MGLELVLAVIGGACIGFALAYAIILYDELGDQ